jgi:hypothetical protein
MDYCFSILLTLTIKNRISGKLVDPVVKFAQGGSDLDSRTTPGK